MYGRWGAPRSSLWFGSIVANLLHTYPPVTSSYQPPAQLALAIGVGLTATCSPRRKYPSLTTSRRSSLATFGSLAGHSVALKIGAISPNAKRVGPVIPPASKASAGSPASSPPFAAWTTPASADVVSASPASCPLVACEREQREHPP